MEGTKFLIVDFLRGNNVRETCVVPSNWIYYHEGKSCCAWPIRNYSTKCQTRANPSDNPNDWTNYYVVIRKDFDTFEAARLRLPKAIVNTDCTSSASEDRGRGKRAKHLKRPYSPDPVNGGILDSTDEETSSALTLDSNVPTVPSNFRPTATYTELAVPNSFQPAATSTQRIPNSQKDDSLNITTSAATLSSEFSQETPGYYSSFPLESTSNQQEPCISQSLEIFSQPIDRSLSSATSEASGSCSGTPLFSLPSLSSATSEASGSSSNTSLISFPSSVTKKTNFTPSQEHFMLMRELKRVTETLKLIDKRLTNIEDKLDRNGLLTPDSGIPISLECLPFKNVDEFLAFNATMKSDPTLHLSLVEIVKRCGGECAKDAIRRSWERITTPECRVAFNWCGRKKKDKKKHKLQGSLIVEAVHAGIRTLFPGVSDCDLEKLTRNRFVRAPEKVNKKKPNVINEESNAE